MNSFLTTSEGKIINLNAIAYVTWRRDPAAKATHEKGSARVSYTRTDLQNQLVVGFSAIAAGNDGVLPLSLILKGEEAQDFLAQLGSAGLDVTKLQEAVVLIE